MTIFFKICAYFNALVVVSFIAGQHWLLPLFGLRADGGTLVFLYMLLSLVAVFGWAYYKIAQDPIRYQEYILLGAQGKLILVAVGLLTVFMGLVLWPIMIPLAIDLVFGVIFIKLYNDIQSQPT